MAIPRRFLADVATRSLKFSAGSGLDKEFSRAIVTIDPDGTRVDPGVPRFDESVRIAAVPGSYTEVLGGGIAGYLLASGVDGNGTDGLLLYLNVSHGRFRIYQNDSTTPLYDYALNVRDVGPNTFAAYAPPKPTTFLDLLDNGTGVGARALQPKTAVIFHGAVVVAGPVWIRQSDGKYELSGWGFALSNNKGAPGSWLTFVHDSDPLQQGQLYVPRGREWCMRAAPIHGARGQANPLSCSICCSDYVFKDQPGGQAVSGRAYYFQILRPGVGSNWTVGQGAYQDKLKVFDIRPTAFRKLNHAHSCVATEWTPPDSEAQGVQLMVSIGDNRVHNRFIRFTHPSYLGDYTTGWTVQENYHGKADAATGPAEATESPQPVVALFGPSPGEIIWTADLRSEWLFLMRLPNGDDLPDQARLEHLYGFGTGVGHGFVSGQFDPPRSRPVLMAVSQARPEVSGHSLAAVYDEESHTGYEPDARRILFCPDSSKPKEWTQILATHSDGSSPTVAIHAGYIYFASFGTGIRRIPIPSLTPASAPTLKSLRPMLVGCGGKNLVKELCFFEDVLNPSNPATVTPIQKISNFPPQWQDGSLPPMPIAPTLADRGLKLRTQRSNSAGYYARVRVSSDVSTSWNTLPPGYQWVTQPTGPVQVRRFRAWLRDGSFDQAAQITPNKTHALYVRLWDETGVNRAGAVNECSVRDRWVPCTNISVQTIADTRALGLRFNAYTSGSDTDKEDNYGYILIAEALDGNGALPYPLAPPPEAEGPDEHLAVTGFSLATTVNWWIKVAGMMPIANWDHYAARGVFNQGTAQFDSDRRWPLLTLWAADDRYVEFLADCENRGFMIRYRTDSGSPVQSVAFGDQKQIWLPDSPWLLAIGFDSVLNRLDVGASLAGDTVRRITGGIPWTAGAPFTKLRFRGATGGYGIGANGEVCESRVIGGEINPGSTLGYDALPSAFANLGFLYVP